MGRRHAMVARMAALGALSALAAAACSGLGGGGTPTEGLQGPVGAPITVGISLPLTGDFSDDGQAFQKGYSLWASDVNAHGGLLGRPVKLVIRDDKSDPKVTVSDYNTLIGVQHVNLILGPFSTLLTV